MFSVIARQTEDRAGCPKGAALPLGQKTNFRCRRSHLILTRLILGIVCVVRINSITFCCDTEQRTKGEKKT